MSNSRKSITPAGTPQGTRRLNIGGRVYDVIPILTYEDWEEHVHQVPDNPQQGEEDLNWWVAHQAEIPEDLKPDIFGALRNFPTDFIIFPQWRQEGLPWNVATLTFRVFGGDTFAELLLAVRHGTEIGSSNNRWDLEFLPSNPDQQQYGRGVWVVRRVVPDASEPNP